MSAFNIPKKSDQKSSCFKQNTTTAPKDPHDVVHLPETSDLPPAVVKSTENPPVQTKTTADTQDPTVEVPGL
eukprot:12237640-Ditylum_brightwellii.AAC.1